MIRDFFGATKDAIRSLNHNERKIFDFVVKHMEEVSQMSIQQFARRMFISTTSIFRFTKKLGFTGYTDFINSLIITTHAQENHALPGVMLREGYLDEYVKNIMETVRVTSGESINRVMDILDRRPNIYILTDDNTHTIAQYSEKLFMGLGFYAYGPEATYQMQSLTNFIEDNDVIVALSYSGEDQAMNAFIERVYIRKKPYLISVTRSENNTLGSMSDTNFYVFSDVVKLHNMDITSSISMMMILEFIVYSYIRREHM